MTDKAHAATQATVFPLAASVSSGPDNKRIGHIPGHYGPLIIGQTARLLSDPFNLLDEYYKKYGPVCKMGMTMQRAVVLMGPEFAQQVTLDPEHNFSTRMGYHAMLKDFFGGSLLTRDFDEHRFHRRIMQTAFKFSSMRHYVSQMPALIGPQSMRWQQQGDDFLFYPAVKKLLLDLGAQIFVGIDLGEETERLNQAFLDMAYGSLAMIRHDWPVPGLLYRKGMNGMRTLDSFLTTQVKARRANDGGGQDILSHFCRETDENGALFDDIDVARHMRFLLLAAHDTTTSALTMAAYQLARNPAWQDRLREEYMAIGRGELEHDDMERLPMTDLVFREIQRLYPAVASLNRRTVRDSEIGGHKVPGNTMVLTSIIYQHRMEKWWSNPHQFDPERFAPERAEHNRHKFLWAPFGGGAHKCIGLHFAQILFKCVLFQLLRNYRCELPEGYPEHPPMQHMPFPKVKDDLPLRLRPLS